jgi:hypothetical protein
MTLPPGVTGTSASTTTTSKRGPDPWAQHADPARLPARDRTPRRGSLSSVVGQLAKPDRDQSLPPCVGEPALLKPRPIEPRSQLRRPQRGVPGGASRRPRCRSRRSGRWIGHRGGCLHGGIEMAEHRPAHRRRHGRLDVGEPGAAEQPGRWVQWLRNRHGGGE